MTCMLQVNDLTQLTCTPTVLIGSRKAFSECRLVICISFSWSSSVVQALTLCNRVCGWENQRQRFLTISRNKILILLACIYTYWFIARNSIWYFSLTWVRYTAYQNFTPKRYGYEMSNIRIRNTDFMFIHLGFNPLSPARGISHMSQTFSLCLIKLVAIKSILSGINPPTSSFRLFVWYMFFHSFTFIPSIPR